MSAIFFMAMSTMTLLLDVVHYRCLCTCEWSGQTYRRTRTRSKGYHHILQPVSDLAPSAHHALVNSRLYLKNGQIITAQNCVGLHVEVERYMRRPDHANRFLPLMDSELQPVPNPKPFAMCSEHVDTKTRHTAASFASRMTDWISVPSLI